MLKTLDIPFPLEPVAVEQAARELSRLRAERPGTCPVLLGDRDIFSAEWAETVDAFEPPEEILAEAEELDIDAWFAERRRHAAAEEAQIGGVIRGVNAAVRTALLPVDAVLYPLRLIRWSITGERPSFLTPLPFDAGALARGSEELHGLAAMKAQLAELEALAEEDDADLGEIRSTLEALESDEALQGLYPDPVDYVTPRSGGGMAAGLPQTREPWEVMAWLQHGTYAATAPKEVQVAYCRWLWHRYGARIITASTDHLGFEVEQPPETVEDAREIVARFAALGASEVNGDHGGSDGASLVNAPRWWVWWD